MRISGDLKDIIGDGRTRRAATEERIRRTHGAAARTLDPAHYAAALGASPRGPGYGRLPAPLHAMAAALARDHRPALPAYNAYLLADRIACFACNGRLRLPDCVARLYPDQLRRIVNQIDAGAPAYLDLGHDAFLKDLAVLTHRLVPLGAGFAEPDAGIPKRVLLARPGQFGRALSAILRAGGFAPYLAMHSHILWLDEFTPEGWLRTYHRLAALLAMNPHLRGWFGASWYNDPALARISPRLAHLHRIPAENGGTLLFVAHDRTGTSGALGRSPTRRQLFAEGRYIPAITMRIWPRAAQIAWSRRQGGGGVLDWAETAASPAET